MIKRRIETLERKIAAAAAGRPCRSCGGPVPGCNWYAEMDEDGRPVCGVCPQCGLALDAEGKALWSYTPKPGQPRWTQVWGPGTHLAALGIPGGRS